MGLDYSELPPAAASLHSAGARLQPLAVNVARKTGYDGAAAAQVAAPVDTGFLESSIGVDLDGDGLGWSLYTTAEYGADVEYGTSGPYPIPNAFGRDGFVMHPGISPQPYMGPAYDVQVGVAEKALAQAAYQVLR